jgi:crotonobetainyl-CoA:carnitine CoA-transferase CaiB-like acyl-CoA transferase
VQPTTEDKGPKAAGPYRGLRLVEFAMGPAGELTGLQFVHLGAEVVKVEPPGGAPSRHVGPFVDGQEDVNLSLNHWYYNGGKRSVVLDLASHHDQTVFGKLLDDADILLVEAHPRELSEHLPDLRAVAQSRPSLIILAITPFGLTGPWSDYLSSDLITLAAGGLLYLSGYDDHALPPIRPTGNQALHTAAAFAHQALQLALIERQRSGCGGLLDLSMQEACAVNVEGANLYWFYPRVRVSRQACRHAQPRPTQPMVFQFADGRSVHFVLTVAEGRAWQSLLSWMDDHGLSAGLTDPMYSDAKYRQENFAHVQGIVEAFFLLLDSRTAFLEGQERGLPVGIMNSPEHLYDDPHFIARKVFRPVQQPGFGEVLEPSTPFRFSEFATVEPQPASRLPARESDNG